MTDLRALARRIAKQHGLDPNIFVAQIQQESGFDPTAKSEAGAQGIAQFIPSTAKQYGVDVNDPVSSLKGAAKYMADNLKRGHGSYAQALSIYNSGRPDAYKDPNFAKGQTYNYVKRILGAAGSTGNKVSSPATGDSVQQPRSTTTTTKFDIGDNTPQNRLAVLQSFFSNRGKPGNVLGLVRGIKGLEATQKTTTTTEQGPSPAGTPKGAFERAVAINGAKLPYKWGGGHAGKAPAGSIPLDCSGAVSAVLGINPRVSGDFAKWGKAGDSGNKGITVYSNNHHVLMKIDGHFFGTSASNPGGGAGWIPHGNISPEYLKGFTARHA